MPPLPPLRRSKTLPRPSPPPPHLEDNGPQTGTQNTTWSKFTPGTPPAAKFDIAGIDECPQAKNCQIETVVRDGALRRSAQRYHTAFFRQEF